jgi:hypothetical protein
MTKDEYKDYRRDLRMKNRSSNPNFEKQLKKLVEENFSHEKYHFLINKGFVKVKIINNCDVPELDFGSILKVPFPNVNFREKLLENYEFGHLQFERFELVGLILDGQFIEFNYDEVSL